MDEDFIIVDFQTTGTVADRSLIIEAAWARYAPAEAELLADASAFLISLPAGESLPKSIQRLTGLTADSFQEGPGVIEFQAMQEELARFLRKQAHAKILLHYSQFKLPFLKKALAGFGDLLETLDQRILCTHQLSKMIFPQLKSHSLRAIAGFAGYSAAEKKRAVDHLMATAHVWRRLQQQMQAGLMTEGTDAQAPSAFQISREFRLGLNTKPGIYMFRDDHGRILYVGKAKQLKQRVNSYFRGRRTKGSRLNEMLTRATHLDVIECGSELEALLRENDAIKSLNPPYNRMLRVEERVLTSFTMEELFGILQGRRPWGPTTSAWLLAFLSDLQQGRDASLRLPLIMRDQFQEALPLFVTRYFPDFADGEAVDWMQLAKLVWASIEEASSEEGEEHLEEEAEQAVEVEAVAEAEVEELDSLDECADFIEGTVRQFLRAVHRSRWLLRLMHANVSLVKPQALVLALRGSVYSFENLDFARNPSYHERMASMDLQLMDRLAIVYAEMQKALRRGDSIHLQLASGAKLDSAALLRLGFFPGKLGDGLLRRASADQVMENIS